MPCTTCKKGPPEVSLKNCAKCQKTPYCSRDCQKVDWKVHKKICGKQASAGAAPGNPDGILNSDGLSPPKGLDGPIAKPFTRLSNGTWLHDRPEKDVYRLLIDAFRMRIEDAYMMDAINTPGTIMAGAPHSLPGFRKFMQRVEAKPGLLPSWWTPEHKANCEALGMDNNKSNWQDLSCSIEKHDVIEHYGDSRFPMQLRMFAESVYGTAPGGFNGAGMLGMMAGMESGMGGDQVASIMDVNSLLRR